MAATYVIEKETLGRDGGSLDASSKRRDRCFLQTPLYDRSFPFFERVMMAGESLKLPTVPWG
jgi:hypothetical protein